MGRRGPPPKPTSLKKAMGTYRKDRDGERTGAALVAPAGAPPRPDDLAGPALELWDKLVADLVPLGTLAPSDGGALEAYCRCIVQWRKLQLLVARTPTVKTPFGPKMNPLSAEARKLHKEVIQPLEVALGLHYAARARVKMPQPPKAKDASEEFLFGGGLKVVDGGKSEDPKEPA
jgi:P27 family predicted phage terminase small subunit